MATSETEVCNSALIKVGAQRILALTDNTKQALLCREQYPKIRDELLASHPWNFAIERATLALLVSTPVYGWDYEFNLPSDCLRVLEIDALGPEEYAIEGTKIRANISELSIKYIKRVTDVATFSPGFSEALAAKIAWDICYSLTQSTTQVQLLESQFDKKIRYARNQDAQEGFSSNRVYANTWLNSRS